MNRFARAIAGTAALLCGAASAFAQDAPGRFTFGADGEAILRIDTVTGAVSRCLAVGDGWLCTPIAETQGPPVPPAEPASAGPAAEREHLVALITALTAALGELAARPAAPDPAAIEALRQQIEAIAATQEGFNALLAGLPTPNVAPALPAEIDRRLAQIEAAVAAIDLPEAALGAITERVVALADTIVALTARVEGVATEDGALRAAIGALAAEQQALAAALIALGADFNRANPAVALADIATRLTAIEDRIAAVRTDERDADFAATLAALNGQFATIEETIAALRTVPPANGNQDPGIRALGEQLAGVAATMEGFAARETDGEILAAIAALTERIGGIEQMLTGLVADPRPAELLAATAQLRNDVGAIGQEQTRLAAAIGGLAALTPAVADLQRQIGALPENLRAAIPDGLNASLTAEVAAIAQQVTALAAAGPANTTGLAAIGEALAAFDGRVQALSLRTELIMPVLSDLVSRQQTVLASIGALPTLVEAQLAPLLEVQSQQTALLRQTVIELLDAHRTDVAAATAGFAEQLTRIDEQIAALPVTDPGALAALAGQIEALARQTPNVAAPPSELLAMLTIIGERQTTIDTRLRDLASGNATLTDTIGALAAQMAAVMANDTDTARSLAAIAENVLALHQGIAGLAPLDGAAPSPELLAGIADRLQGLETAVAGLAAGDNARLTAALGALMDRLTTLETAVLQLPAPLDAVTFGEATTGLRADLGQLREAVGVIATGITTPTPDPAVEAVRQQLAQLLTAQQTLLAELPARAAAPEIVAAVQGLATQVTELQFRLSGLGTAAQAVAVLDAVGLVVQGQADIETMLAAPQPPPATEIATALEGLAQEVIALRTGIQAVPGAPDMTVTLAPIAARLEAIEARLSAVAPAGDGTVAELRALRDQIATIAPPPAPDLTPLVYQLLEQQRATAEAIRVLSAEIARLGFIGPPAREIPPRAEAAPPPPAEGPAFGEDLMQRLFGFADDIREGLN